jgi:hypothetical protein
MALSDGVVSAWKMDETSGSVIDSAGSNTGTVTGTPTRNGAGLKSGYTFSGTQFISCGDDSSLKVGHITVNAWIQTNPGAGNYYPIFCHYTYGASPYGNGIWCEEQYIRFYVHDSSTHALERTGSTNIASASAWHMITCTADGSVIKIYVDGALETLQEGGTSGSFPYDLAWTTGEIQFRIGYRDADDLYMVGKIDDVTVWDRALSAAEITSLYNSGDGLAYPFGAAATYAGVLYIYNGSIWVPKPMANYAPSAFTSHPLYAYYNGQWNLIQSF